MKGELLLARSPSDQAGAEASFREALESRAARARSPGSFARRRASPGCGITRAGREGRGPRSPRPVYDWFTEGFDTQDLKDAKALLEELA